MNSPNSIQTSMINSTPTNFLLTIQLMQSTPAQLMNTMLSTLAYMTIQLFLVPLMPSLQYNYTHMYFHATSSLGFLHYTSTLCVIGCCRCGLHHLSISTPVLKWSSSHWTTLLLHIGRFVAMYKFHIHYIHPVHTTALFITLLLSDFICSLYTSYYKPHRLLWYSFLQASGTVGEYEVPYYTPASEEQELYSQLRHEKIKAIPKEEIE